MQDFTYYVPTEVVFGKSALGQLPALVTKYGGKNVFVVYGGGSVVRSGLLQRVETALKDAGVNCTSFGGVKPNPTLAKAREGVQQALACHADMILAVGGGSVIDTAKAIAHGVATPDVDIWTYWTKESPLTATTPLGVVLTIPATGSETSDSAVITNTDTGSKWGLNTPFNRPTFAIMDPELASTLPKYQVACGVTDIMMHTIDRYFSLWDDNETSDEIAEGLLRVVLRNGPLVYADASNYHAMSEIMWCGSLSHNGLTGAGGNFDFSTHKLGHELSAMFDVAHGASLSAMWGHYARYVITERPDRFARYAVNVMGLPEQDDHLALGLAGIEKMEEFFHSLQMPTCFTELGIGVQSSEVIEDLATRCSRNKTLVVGNFRPLAYEDMIHIYEAANH